VIAVDSGGTDAAAAGSTWRGGGSGPPAGEDVVL